MSITLNGFEKPAKRMSMNNMKQKGNKMFLLCMTMRAVTSY